MLNVAMFGATGRMGRSIVPLAAESADFRLCGALAAATDPAIGQDAGVVAGTAALGVGVTGDVDRALVDAQVVIDFTLATATLGHARRCLARSVPMVIGTTGHDEQQLSGLRAVADGIPIVMAPNFSLGVNLLLKLTELAARALDAGYDAEVFEAHHRHKVDAPSGTALGLGRAVARGRGASLDDVAIYARQGATGPRPAGAIGFSVVRGGDVVGDHRVIFAGPGEQIELAHRAEDRSTFARGALAAARWVVGRPPGLYTMLDVLGI